MELMAIRSTEKLVPYGLPTCGTGNPASGSSHFLFFTIHRQSKQIVDGYKKWKEETKINKKKHELLLLLLLELIGY
jgi:hypothetical protein